MMLEQQSELLGRKEIQGITPNKAPIGLFRIIASHVQGRVLYLQETLLIIRIIIKDISTQIDFSFCLGNEFAISKVIVFASAVF
jgi:hypothetical protein